MEVADAQAQALVRLEAAVRGHHVDGGRFERVVRRKDQVAVVLATEIRRILWSTDDVVPVGKE